MNWKYLSQLFVALAALTMSSCSGLNSVCTNCNSGNATVTVTMFDTPPAGTSVLSFSLPIAGISLTPSSGSPVSLYSPSSAQPFELTKLQTDSALVASAVTVAAGTYTSLNITLGTTSGIWINASSSNISYKLSGSTVSCNVGQVCILPAGAATTVNVPINLTLSGNQKQWVGIDVNLNNAILSTNGITVDFTQTDVFTVATTTRTGLPSGAVDTIEDFTGQVTALNNSSISVENAITGQTLSVTVTPSTVLSTAPVAYSNCNSSNAALCIQVGSTVSMNANLAADGTLTATEIDGLDLSNTDEIEGVIYPTTTAGVVGLILADKSSASGNAVLSAATTTYGTPIFLSAGSNINYNADSGPLANAPGFNPLIGFTGSGDLLAGQVVRAQVTNVVSSNSSIQATATNVLLRWSRIAAAVNSVAGNNFTLTNLPAYIPRLNPTLALTPLVNSYPSYTAFDGVTGTTDTAFVTGTQLAIRALYINNNSPAFQAAKVRVP